MSGYDYTDFMIYEWLKNNMNPHIWDVTDHQDWINLMFQSILENGYAYLPGFVTKTGEPAYFK